MSSVLRVQGLGTHLLQVVDPGCGLDSDLEEVQDASHHVDHSLGDVGRGADVADVSADVVEGEGFEELAGDALGELRRCVEAVSAREAVELLEGKV